MAELNADTELKARIERLRIACGHAMGLADVTTKNYPKMTLIAPPREGGSLATRSFIPHVCHDAIGVLAAVTVGTACVLEGSVCDGIAMVPAGNVKKVSVEHPTGEFSVELEVDAVQPAERHPRRAVAHRPAHHARRGHGSRVGLERKSIVIIDCHGHYTTAPKALEEWRNRQIAGIKDPAVAPKASRAGDQRRRDARSDRDQPARPR